MTDTNSITLNNVPIEWQLEKGTFSFFGIDSTLFWNDPSLLRMLKPLADEIGYPLFRLLVAKSSSLGTHEDYHAMITMLSDNFKEGFLKWGNAVSAAGWGRFSISSLDYETNTATVILTNPWELRMQKTLVESGESWGCPFIQGKLIGIFSHAFNTPVWADESVKQIDGNTHIEFSIYPHNKTIESELKDLRIQHDQKEKMLLQEKLEQKSNELIFQANHDSLTKLPNRAYLYNNIANWVFPGALPFSVLFIDLDNFKNINDNFGHRYGDAILIEVADRIRGLFKKEDTIVRQGGDEFIILTKTIDPEAIDTLCKKTIDCIAKPYLVKDIEFTIGISIGVANYPAHGDDFDAALSAADIAMYEAKKTKNSHYIFSAEMHKNNLQQIEIEHQLRMALEKNELYMVYQPQLDTQGRFYGVEALLRWENDKLGNIPPDLFIPIAETTGMMPKIGHFIIEQSLQDISKIQKQLQREFQLSINISIRQLMEINFIDTLQKSIDQYSFKEQKLTLEITENIFIEEFDYVRPLLEHISSRNILISLDDFGTGFSSLSMLRKLPISELKIDKSFVDEILDNKYDEAMLDSIIALGKNVGISTLAEGVEKQEQLELLQSLGCDLIQGYYYSKPLDKSDLTKFLSTSSEPKSIPTEILEPIP